MLETEKKIQHSPYWAASGSLQPRWAIGGRWLQSPASQDGDGRKPAFKDIFDNVIGRGSLQFLACEYVLDIANLSYNNGQSSPANTASRSTFFGGRQVTRWRHIGRGGWLGGWEAGDIRWRNDVSASANYEANRTLWTNHPRIHNTTKSHSDFDRLNLHDLVLSCHTEYELMLMC